MNAIWCLAFCHSRDSPHIAEAKTCRFSVLRQVQVQKTSRWGGLSNVLQKRSRNHARLADRRELVSPGPCDCRRDE
jgi:hypothetical protein